MPWNNLVHADYTRLLFGHWDALVFLVSVPLIFILGRYLLSLYFWYHDRSFSMRHELVEADNKAVCVALVGVEAGLALTAWGALYDQDVHDYTKNVTGGFVWFFIGVAFMAIFFIFTDKVTLRSYNITVATRKGNVAAALCVASNFVSSGIVALYTIGGGVDRWDEAIGSGVIYFVLCRVFLSLSQFGFRFVFRRFGSLQEEVERANPAAGVLLFMMQTGVSIFVTNPMRSSEEILAFFLWCGLGAVAIVVMDLLMAYVIVTRDGIQEFSEGRWGGVFVEGCGVIAMALAVIPFLPNTCAYTAQLTESFAQRLGGTETTRQLFQWPNLFYFAIIICYVCGAKLLYVLPSLHGLHPRLWQYAIRFFLATAGDLPQLAKEDSLRSVGPSGIFAGDAMVTLRSEPSIGSVGKVRGRKRHLLKEQSGVYADGAEEGCGDHNLAAPARGIPIPQTDGGAADLSPSASLASKERGRKSNKGPQGTGGLASEGGAPVNTSAEGNDLAEPLAMVPEVSIDFEGYAAKEGAARSAYDTTTRISDSRAVSFGGMLLAVGYLLRASFATTIGASSLAEYEVVLYTLFWLGVCTVTFVVGTILQSLLLWRHFRPPSRTNLASGIVLFGLLISVALQAGSSIMANQEDGPFDIAQDLPEALFVFAIQMVLIACSGHVYQYLSSYDDQRAVAEGNTAAAVANAGFLIASSLLASAPTTKTSELAAFAAFFSIGSIMAHGSTYLIVRKVIFGGRSTDDEVLRDCNWGAAAVEAIVGIGTAYAYSALMPELCAAVASSSPSVAPSTTVPPVNGTWH